MHDPTRALRPLLAVCLLAAAPCAADGEGGTRFAFDGHVKYRVEGASFPGNSTYRRLTGETALDQGADVRLNFGFDRGPWDLQIDYQFIALGGDTVEFTRAAPPGLLALSGRLPGDDRRLFDLTRVITDERRIAALARLDRLSVGYTGNRAVARFGRQAISWGNGLVYTPMDVVNPFDPTAVDKEYKSGDDMFYGQWLRDGGDDVQGVVVFRRNLASGDVAADDSTLALKYHGFGGESEYDLLAARHYGETLLAVGGNRSIGGAVWRGDAVFTHTGDEVVAGLVTNLSYSWVWGGHNVSGVAEYFYNGFGQAAIDYGPAALAANPDLISRIARGELFTLGRHYLALSATIEVTPLFVVTPSLFTNLADPSALLQVSTQNDLAENLVLLGALNVPMGDDGSEIGGIPSGVPGEFLSTRAGLFLQLGWYF